MIARDKPLYLTWSWRPPSTRKDTRESALNTPNPHAPPPRPIPCNPPTPTTTKHNLFFCQCNLGFLEGFVQFWRLLAIPLFFSFFRKALTNVQAFFFSRLILEHSSLSQSKKVNYHENSPPQGLNWALIGIRRAKSLLLLLRLLLIIFKFILFCFLVIVFIYFLLATFAFVNNSPCTVGKILFW